MRNAERNKKQQAAFAAWAVAQDEADQVKKRWGVSNPHDANASQEKARMAMAAWMAV